MWYWSGIAFLPFSHWAFNMIRCSRGSVQTKLGGHIRRVRSVVQWLHMSDFTQRHYEDSVLHDFSDECVARGTCFFYATPNISRYSNETSLMGSIRAGSSTPAGGFHVDFLLIEGTRIQRKVRFRRLLSNFPFSLVYDSNPCKVGDASNLSFYLCPCRQTIFVSAATRQPLLSPGPSRLLNKYEKETGGKKYDCNGRGAPKGAPAL